MKKLLVTALLSIGLASTASAQTIVDIAAKDGRFKTLVAAVQAAGLADTLSGSGHFTVFAPTDEAFKALPAGTVDTLLKPENKKQLTDILLYHVDDRVITSKHIRSAPTPIKPLLTSKRLCIEKEKGGVTVADGSGSKANVVIADIKASNGVIHVIDKVLIPGPRPKCH